MEIESRDSCERTTQSMQVTPNHYPNQQFNEKYERNNSFDFDFDCFEMAHTVSNEAL